MAVFVPFLGDFLSITSYELPTISVVECFRPLSWGLSFNFYHGKKENSLRVVFVPFLGDFLSIRTFNQWCVACTYKFSSPFLGTFFQLPTFLALSDGANTVFVPFLGDFLSMAIQRCSSTMTMTSFRPLSWGLSFNNEMVHNDKFHTVFSSPFLGTFFQ